MTVDPVDVRALVDALARPTFNLRMADGILSPEADSTSSSMHRSAETRRANATRQIHQLVIDYARRTGEFEFDCDHGD